MTTHLILGTAGHIDHGKTALVRALTGTDTDRLPEEKKRGITIELGFAALKLGDLHLGIVDVPGHERFVRQMLAGATGMDLAMLVVAADDSVKPQTREHMDVLRLLRLQAGVIVLTKCDLPDPDWIELVEAEVRELAQDSFLQDARIVRTSATTGAGIEELRDALVDAARRAVTVGDDQLAAPFRLAIDRSFAIEGHGTVVTGSISSGRVSVGDTLVIQPDEIEVRVRGLQNHDSSVQSMARGQRAAINLAGVHHYEIRRGHELATRGHLCPSNLLTVRLELSTYAPRPLKQRSRVRLHIGTAEVLGIVSLMGQGTVIEPGQVAMVQLHLSEAVAAVWNQPFVIRSESPVVTIGGGSVLVPTASKIRKIDRDALDQLSSLAGDDELARAGAAVYFADPETWQPTDLARLAGVVDVDASVAGLESSGAICYLPVSPQQSLVVHRRIIDDWKRRIVLQLSRLHDANPLRSLLEMSQVVQAVSYLGRATAIEALLRQMTDEGTLRRTAKGIGLADRQPKLNLQQKQLLQSMVEKLRLSEFQPPTVKELEQKFPKQRKDVATLIQLAVSEGDVLHIAADMFIHAEAEEKMRCIVREALTSGEGMTLSAIRELLGTTRKYAVPFCEYLDKIGFTRRQGDLRVLA